MTGLPANPSEAYPTPVSAGVALLAILCAALVGSTGPLQIAPLLVEAGGVLLFAGGITLRRRGYRIVGRVLSALGFIIALSALVGAVALSPPVSTLSIVLSCGLGVLLVTVGIFPVSVRIAEPLARIGMAFVLASVLANAIIGDSAVWRSTVAVTMVFLAWDTSARALTLGGRVGGTAETITVEVVGAAVSSLVAVIAILLTITASRIPVASSSLVGLSLLLVAVTAFLLALAHVPPAPERQK